MTEANPAPRPFWHEDRHRDRRPFLLARTRIKAALRGWFAAQGFIEVETGAVQVSPGNGTYLHGMAVGWRPDGGVEATRYLVTSPEFAAKKLLAAGERLIVDFARVWRNGEAGALHSPEFTMVEWYRAGADYAEVMADAVALCRVAAGGNGLHWRGQHCDPEAPPQRLSLCEAFAAHVGADLADLLDDRNGLAAVLAARGLTVAASDNWSDLFSKAVVALIEPQLGRGTLTLLDRYPISEAALARPCPDDPRFAERFELYACGVELANGFGELTDVAVQRDRFEADMAEQQRIYGHCYPLDEDFLAALAHMPTASGVALGLDRLVMLASGARHINDVIWTPFPL
jgi:lysyl-tRNA synthetase class 2